MLSKQMQDKQASFRFKTTAEANGVKTTILNAVKSSKHSDMLAVVSADNNITVTAKDNEAGAWLQSFEKNARRALNVRDAKMSTVGSASFNSNFLFSSTKAAKDFEADLKMRLQRETGSSAYLTTSSTNGGKTIRVQAKTSPEALAVVKKATNVLRSKYSDSAVKDAAMKDAAIKDVTRKVDLKFKTVQQADRALQKVKSWISSAKGVRLKGQVRSGKNQKGEYYVIFDLIYDGNNTETYGRVQRFIHSFR